MFTRCAECSHVPKHVQWAAACKSVMWKVTNLWPQITWRWAANNGYKHCSALPSAFWKAPSPTRQPGQEGAYKSTRVGKHGVCFPSAEQGARPAKCHSTRLAAATLCNEAMFTSLVLAQFCCTQREPARGAGVSGTGCRLGAVMWINFSCARGRGMDATIKVASLVPALGQPSLCGACSQLLCKAGFLPFTPKRFAVLLDFKETTKIK